MNPKPLAQELFDLLVEKLKGDLQQEDVSSQTLRLVWDIIKQGEFQMDRSTVHSLESDLDQVLKGIDFGDF